MNTTLLYSLAPQAGTTVARTASCKQCKYLVCLLWYSLFDWWQNVWPNIMRYRPHTCSLVSFLCFFWKWRYCDITHTMTYPSWMPCHPLFSCQQCQSHSLAVLIASPTIEKVFFNMCCLLSMHLSAMLSNSWGTNKHTVTKFYELALCNKTSNQPLHQCP